MRKEFRDETKNRKKDRKKEMNLRYARRSEATEQIKVMYWAKRQQVINPELKWLHHCPNEGERSKATGEKLKQLGLKAGVSDLCLPYPRGSYCGLYIEMKFGDGRHTKEQKEFLADMVAAGHYVITCYTALDAIEAIREYLSLENWFKRASTAIQENVGDVEGNKPMNMRIPNNSKAREGETK